MRNSFLLILSLIILSSFSMEPTYKGELNWRVCGIYNALKNNYPIVKAALLDYIITDSIESFPHKRYFYKLRYKIINNYNVNTKDTIINSEDAIGKYPLFPEWDTVIFINYKNKWIQDYTDGSYHELKMDFIINVISKYYNNDKNMPKDSISNDIIKSILNRNCDAVFKEYDKNIISKPISGLLKVFIESKRQSKSNKNSFWFLTVEMTEERLYNDSLITDRV